MKKAKLHAYRMLPGIFGSLLILILAIPADASPSYWDLMKTPVRSGNQIDLTIAFEPCLPFGPPPDSDDSSGFPVYGGGLTFGLHWHLGQWILGVEIGVWSFMENHYHDYKPEGKPQPLMMMPVYGVFGYQFNPTSWLSITPALGLGISSDFILYDYEGMAPPGADDWDWYASQIFRFMTKFTFHFTDFFAMYLGISMNLSIKYPEVKMGPFSTLQLGTTFKFK